MNKFYRTTNRFEWYDFVEPPRDRVSEAVDNLVSELGSIGTMSYTQVISGYRVTVMRERAAEAALDGRGE